MGEQEAITLEAGTPNAVLLIDDRDGRIEAERSGVRVIGTLAVLGDALASKLVDISAVERLQRTSFRASPKLFKALLDRLSN